MSFSIGSFSNQNYPYRKTMEDTFHYDISFMKTPYGNNSYFGIFDGHGGKLTADWCANNFHQLLSKNFIKYSSNLQIPTIIDFTFQQADIAIQNDSKIIDNSGSTAAIAYVCNSPYDNSAPHLYTANVGDSRIILCSDNGIAHRMTYDHSADDANEKSRINRSGGNILLGRVSGVLAITRALGDTSLKNYVCARPYITETRIDSEKDEFLILASDGVWDVFTDQEAVDKIRSIKDPNQAAKLLVTESIRRGSMDNVTCMIVRFTDGRSNRSSNNLSSILRQRRQSSNSTTNNQHTHVINKDGLPLSPLSPSETTNFSNMLLPTTTASSRFKHTDMASFGYGLDRPPSPPAMEMDYRDYSENNSNVDALQSEISKLSLKTGKRFRYGMPRVEQPLIFDGSNYEDAIEDD